MNKKEDTEFNKFIESIVIWFWVCCVTTTCILSVVIIGGHFSNRDSLVNYQEECVQNHVEYKLIAYTEEGKTLIEEHNGIKTYWLGRLYSNETVCDKYALVRYVESERNE